MTWSELKIGLCIAKKHLKIFNICSYDTQVVIIRSTNSINESISAS